MNKKNRCKNGYIAITSAVIISILIMGFVFAVSFSGFFNRFNVLDSSLKETANNLAEACADAALLKLAENSAYSGNENISIDGYQCNIFQIETAANQKIIKTKAVVGSAVANFKVTVDAASLVVVSWEELANI
jgi:hypothetical protein